MSTETKAALADAITAHLEAEYGDATQHWTVVAGTISLDTGLTSTAIEAPEEMPSYIQRGLLAEALALLDQDDD